VTGFATDSFLLGLILSLVSVAVLLLLTLAIAQRVGRHSGIDVTWGLGFAVVAAVTWAASLGEGGSAADLRRSVVLVLTAAWGLRLAAHIWWRARRHEGEDPRYEELLARGEARGIGRTRYAVTRIYLSQGISLWFISLPVQVAMAGRGGLGWLGCVGIGLFAVGLFFEAVGDHQLSRFRSDPRSRGQVLDTGLWRYTRHPNYFGDACVWWGLSLIAFEQWPGILTLLSPLLMTWLLVRGTGATLLESTIGDRREGYGDYVTRTSGFVPRPPKAAPPRGVKTL
jgi:steroid 5-alpha reductase family enzyme